MKMNCLLITFKPKILVFLGIFVLLSPAVLGQFYVFNHDLVSIEDQLSIQDQFIYINTHIYGEGQIIFNAEQEQVLFAKYNTQLPSLAIYNTSQFTIHNAITIHGDLEIVAGHLKLHNTIILKGQLHQDDDARIEGMDLIVHQTHIKTQPSPLHLPQNSLSFKSVYNHLYPTSNLFWHTESKSKVIGFYTATTPHRLTISILTPPPKYRV